MQFLGVIFSHFGGFVEITRRSTCPDGRYSSQVWSRVAACPHRAAGWPGRGKYTAMSPREETSRSRDKRKFGGFRIFFFFFFRGLNGAHDFWDAGCWGGS